MRRPKNEIRRPPCVRSPKALKVCKIFVGYGRERLRIDTANRREARHLPTPGALRSLHPPNQFVRPLRYVLNQVWWNRIQFEQCLSAGCSPARSSLGGVHVTSIDTVTAGFPAQGSTRLPRRVCPDCGSLTSLVSEAIVRILAIINHAHRSACHHIATFQ